MKPKNWSRMVALLPAVLLLGCRSSLSVPLVDMSVDSRPNATVERERNRSLENRVRDLERENRELREQMKKLERAVGKGIPKPD